MKYNEHDSYQIGYQLSNLIWEIVKKWDYFSQSTVGRQLVRSTDSISSNIAEGWHRYYKKDKVLFYNYARSTFYESVDFINKSIKRKLISQDEAKIIGELTRKFPHAVNGLIKSTQENLKR